MEEDKTVRKESSVIKSAYCICLMVILLLLAGMHTHMTRAADADAAETKTADVAADSVTAAAEDEAETVAGAALEDASEGAEAAGAPADAAAAEAEEDAVRDVVIKLCRGMRKYDYDQISGCLWDDSALIYVDEENAEAIHDFIKENNKNSFKYTIAKVTVDGDQARVSVGVRFPNACDLFVKAMDQLFLYATSNPDSKEERGIKKFGKFVTSYAELIHVPIEKENLVMTLTKKDGEWKVDQMTERMNSVLNDQYMKALKDFQNSYGGDG